MMGDRNPLRGLNAKEVIKKITGNKNYRETRGRISNGGFFKSKAEIRFEQLLIEHGIFDIEYKGCGKLRIGNKETGYKYPDFNVKGTNKLIEVDGCTGTHFRPDHDIYKSECENFYKKLGFNVLVVDMRETNDEIIKKVNYFLHNGIEIVKITKVNIGEGKGNGNWGKEVNVYNFECYPINNYFVNRVLVHNCDNPIIQSLTFGWDTKDANKLIEENKPILCLECGSTKLSCIAADRAGVEDERVFNKMPRPKYSEPVVLPHIDEIINRLVLVDNHEYANVRWYSDPRRNPLDDIRTGLRAFREQK
jgi:hypothetical protein